MMPQPLILFSYRSSHRERESADRPAGRHHSVCFRGAGICVHRRQEDLPQPTGRGRSDIHAVQTYQCDQAYRR